MKFLKRPVPHVEEPPVRRRPVGDIVDEQRPQAFSYYSQRSGSVASSRQPLDPFLGQKSPVKPVWRSEYRLVGAPVIVLIITGLVWGSLLGTDPKIVPVTEGGSAYFLQDTTVYRQAASHVLASSILNRSKFTADTPKISSTLTTEFPELKSAVVSLSPIGQQPVIKLIPYEPSLILTTAHSGAYLLDSNGRALIAASQITNPGELSVPTVHSLTLTSAETGKQLLSTQSVIFISQIASLLAAGHIDFGDMTMPAGETELDVVLAGKSNYVKFNVQEDARQQVGTFLAAQGRLEHDKTLPSQYIDVRLLGRAYYK